MSQNILRKTRQGSEKEAMEGGDERWGCLEERGCAGQPGDLECQMEA